MSAQPEQADLRPLVDWFAAAGAATARRARDAYFTPPEAVRPFFRAIAGELGLLHHVIEPSAGDGALVGELVREGVKPNKILAVDIHAPSLAKCQERHGCATHTGDFLRYSPRFELPTIYGVVANPPYGDQLPEYFLRHVMTWEQHGHKPELVAMLLRLNWLGSQRRSSLLRQWTPDVYVLSERPDFTGAGGDMTEYAWFVWRPNDKPRPAQLHMLPPYANTTQLRLA